ncbi:MAG: T9SS type A sorting domain-containing protein [Chlorobi bacterium]|nr:T9SS type A sorting domain-containing protein [Chlorobiota bacterium]
MKRIIFTLSVVITTILLSINLYAQPVNDLMINAIDVSTIINSCSANAAYTTKDGTSDGIAASNWNTHPDYNVWFKFRATTNQIFVEVKRGGKFGNIKRINLALWESDGTTELISKRYSKEKDNVSIAHAGLIPGNWYYISVDNKKKSRQGTFTLCINDKLSNDYFEGAIDVSELIDTCSAFKAYTTVDATPDKIAASTWNTKPYFNVWFKFIATSQHMRVTINRGKNQGNIKNINVALWESDGISELASKRYHKKGDSVTIEVQNTLIPGKWYYISVDNKREKYCGSFTLYLDDLIDEQSNSTSNGVGGGNWNDPNSWTDGTIPALNSNVIINATDSIIITSNIIVNNLSVLGDLTTASLNDTYNIEVKGDIINNGVFITGKCEIKLTGSNNQNISGTFYNLTVNKSSGQVNLSNNLVINNILDLTSGKLVLGNYNLQIENSASTAIKNGNQKSYIQADQLGKVIWKVVQGNTMNFPIGDVDDYSPFSFILNSGVLNSANISLQVTDGVYNQLSGSNYISRYWTLEPTGISNPDYSVSYIYTDNDIVGDESAIFPAKYHSGWSHGNALADVVNNTLNWNNITSFSDFTGGGSGTLPVELVEFNVKPESSTINVKWATLSEKNNDFFTVERSKDGVNFDILDFVNGNGNSNRLINYEYIDLSPLNGISYYRLKQTDFDGKFEYSDIVSVSDQVTNILEFKIYPNPVIQNKPFNIRIYGLVPETEITVEIINSIGNIMKSEKVKADLSGNINQFIDTYNLKCGLYFVTFVYQNQMKSSKLIIK